MLRIYGRRHLTRLEAALYGGIAAILIAVVAERLLDYMELAERTSVEATVNQVMSAANTRLAYATIRGEALNLEAWNRRNPFELAGMSPVNFVGEIDLAQASNLARGSWAFDRERAELVYQPRLGLGLHTTDPHGALRFRGGLVPGALGYRLVPASPYRWD